MFELNSFLCMDCIQGMKEIPDKYFDLAIIDPEYGRKEHGGKDRSTLVEQKNGSKIFVPGGNYPNRNWDNKPAGEEYFRELFRVSKHQIIWGENYMPVKFGKGRIVWDKCNQGSDQSDCEIAYNSLTERVDLFRYMWRGMFQGKSITEGHIQQGNKKLNEKRIHPTQKPIALYLWQLQKYAQKGWKILDTHVGSASSLIACDMLGFDFLGFEKDKYIYDLANERLWSYKKQIRIDDLMEV